MAGAGGAGGPGGLAASVIDAAGFTWDLGGHVLFSHFGEFDALLEEVMGDDVLSHDRSSFIRFGERWVPYPFQNNLRYLPDAVRDECLRGLGQAPGGNPGMDFAAWIGATFGPGIARHFMYPYNLKVWATPLDEMSSGWIAERVSVVDYERALRNVEEGRDDVAWDPNNRFVFPARGGTGEIYTRLAAKLGERIQYGRPVVQIDAPARRVTAADGGEEGYDALLTTMPLDRLVRLLDGAPQSVCEAGEALRHSSVYMVGVGYESPLLDDKSWMYFPDTANPFYRVTNFAKYAAENLPGGDTSRYCSFMTETSFSAQRPVARDALEERVERSLRAPASSRGGRRWHRFTWRRSSTPIPSPRYIATQRWPGSSLG